MMVKTEDKLWEGIACGFVNMQKGLKDVSLCAISSCLDQNLIISVKVLAFEIF